MNTKRTVLISLAVIFFSVLIGIYLYPHMPERIATHWNAHGQVNGYMGKFWGLFLIPMVSLVFMVLLTLIPAVDPLKGNIGEFRKYYNNFILLMVGFLFYLFILTILWNLQFRFAMLQYLAPALGAIFYYCGILLKHAKPNWSIGIRTSWTLSSQNVWTKTHQRGGALYQISGILAFAGIFTDKYAIWFTLAPILLFSLYLFIYSYLEYRKEKKLKA